MRAARIAWAAEAAPVESLSIVMRLERFRTTCIMLRKPYMAALGSRSVMALDVCSTASLAAFMDLTLISMMGRVREELDLAPVSAREAWLALLEAFSAVIAASPRPVTETSYSSSSFSAITAPPWSSSGSPWRTCAALGSRP